MNTYDSLKSITIELVDGGQIIIDREGLGAFKIETEQFTMYGKGTYEKE